MERVRAQFETNVFGLVRMCQLVLPGMREQRWGKIVNVSSMGGQPHLPRRRALPRDEVRGRGALRRAALRGPRLRRRRGRDRARADPHRVLRRPRCTAGCDDVRRRAVRRVQRARGEAPPRASTSRAALGAARRPARGGRGEDRQGAGGRPPARPLHGHAVRAGDDRPSARCCPTSAWDAAMRTPVPAARARTDASDIGPVAGAGARVGPVPAALTEVLSLAMNTHPAHRPRAARAHRRRRRRRRRAAARAVRRRDLGVAEVTAADVRGGLGGRRPRRRRPGSSATRPARSSATRFASGGERAGRRASRRRGHRARRASCARPPRRPRVHRGPGW